MITLKQLREAEEGDILENGMYVDPVFGIGILWLAVKGYGQDWAIYYTVDGKDITRKSIEHIKKEGKKLKVGSSIKLLVRCEKSVTKYYRF